MIPLHYVPVGFSGVCVRWSLSEDSYFQWSAGLFMEYDIGFTILLGEGMLNGERQTKANENYCCKQHSH